MKRIAAFLLASLFIASASAVVHADQSADNQKVNQLLKQVMTATQAVHALTADISDTETMGGKTVQKTGTVALLKPNFLLEEVWQGTSHSESSPHEILASDGHFYWQIAPDGRYFKDSASADGSNVGNTDSIDASGLPDMASFITLFFNPSVIAQLDPAAKTSVGSEDWNGQTYQFVSQMVESKDPSGKQASITAKLDIGPDNLVHRVTITITTMGSLELQLLNMKTDAALTKADFAFAPPSWAKPDKTNSAAPGQQ